MTSPVKGMDYDHASLFPHTKCLSSSQVLKYLESPSEFFTEYVVGLRRPQSQAMLIGSVFSAMYADRKFKWREALQNGGVTNARIYRALGDAIALFPVIPKKSAEYPMKCKFQGWSFRATLDGYHGNIDIENKTGSTVWDQARADESMQVTFQYWCKWHRDKALYDKCLLNWVDLRANATKLVHSFDTYRSLEELDEFEKKVAYVINGIESESW